MKTTHIEQKKKALVAKREKLIGPETQHQEYSDDQTVTIA